jgi:CheY-like chemotaxis protein
MPGMTGTQLIEAIRSEWPDTPVILATGYSELPAGTAPDVHRLAKPFTQSDLAQAVSATMARPDDGRVVPFRRG